MNETTDTKTQTATATVEAAPKRSRKAPAKATAAKTAPVVAAPVAAEAPKTAAHAGAKLRWQVETDHGDGKTQSSTTGDRRYEIARQADGTYTATVTVGGREPETLSTTTFARAYNSAVAHNKGQSTATAA